MAHKHLNRNPKGTRFPDIGERMTNGLNTLAPSTLKITVMDHPERKYAIVIGGSAARPSCTVQKDTALVHGRRSAGRKRCAILRRASLCSWRSTV